MGKANSFAAVAFMVFVMVASVAFVLGIAAAVSAISWIARPDKIGPFQIFIVGAGCAAVLCLVGAYKLLLFVEQQVTNAEQLPYVPPVTPNPFPPQKSWCAPQISPPPRRRFYCGRLPGARRRVGKNC
jgi:hypothetical protein